jgi:hypothetical protein
VGEKAIHLLAAHLSRMPYVSTVRRVWGLASTVS